MKPDSKFREIWSQVQHFKRSLTTISFVVCVGLVASVIFHSLSHPRASEEAIIEAQSTMSRIERDIGITVRYTTPYKIVDGWPLELPTDLIAYDPLELNFLPVVAQALEKAVTPYPAGFLKKYCGILLVTGTLELSHQKVAGTYGQGWILLSVMEERFLYEKAREVELQHTFHHECASQIYDNDAWTILAFKAAWPEELVPLQDVSSKVRQAQKSAPDPSTGFLTAYSMTTPSNDFSVYAEFIFAHPEQMRDLASQHPKVREKLNMVLASYERADPLFKAYFDAHGLSDINK